jgi:hypothetical protein
MKGTNMAKHHKQPKIKWSAQIDLGPGTDSFITLSGTASDVTSAALAGSVARQAIMDSLDLDTQLGLLRR